MSEDKIFLLAWEVFFFLACSSSIDCLTGVSVKTCDFPFLSFAVFSFLEDRFPNGLICSALDVDAIDMFPPLKVGVDASLGWLVCVPVLQRSVCCIRRQKVIWREHVFVKWGNFCGFVPGHNVARGHGFWKCIGHYFRNNMYCH